MWVCGIFPSFGSKEDAAILDLRRRDWWAGVGGVGLHRLIGLIWGILVVVWWWMMCAACTSYVLWDLVVWRSWGIAAALR